MKITINPNYNQPYTVDSWPVSNEPPRISVEKNNKSYALVLSDEGVFVETWSLDEHSELKSIIDTVTLF